MSTGNNDMSETERLEFIERQRGRATELISAAERSNDHIWAADLYRMANHMLDTIKAASK